MFEEGAGGLLGYYIVVAFLFHVRMWKGVRGCDARVSETNLRTFGKQ